MNENELLKLRGAGLLNIFDNLRDGWQWLVGGAVIGLLGGGVVLGVNPPKYEAVVLVQVGQVGQVGHVDSQPVESVPYAVERMKSATFHLRVAESIGDKDWSEHIKSSGAGGIGNFSPRIIKTASIIDLKVVTESKEKAMGIAAAVIAELAKIHAELAKPRLDKLKSDLSMAKEKLASAEKEREVLDRVISATGVKDERLTQLLMVSQRSQKEAEIYGLRQMVSALETALSEPATLPAKAVEPVFAPERPVSPRKGTTMALGLIGGLLAGAMLFLVRAAWRRARYGQLA